MVAVPRRIAVGLHIPPQPPLGVIRLLVFFARLIRLDSVTVADHFQGVFPTALWDKEFLWIAGQNRSPHEYLDYQTLLGYLASRAGKVRLAVGVTEPIRRHPVLIAQAMLTLSHMTKRAPILGLGAGERENIEPYGLDFSHPVDRLEEALKVIHLCFSSQGPIDFHGNYYRLDNAVMDLRAPKGNIPEVWIASHGVRMLRLTGIYADGWYPTIVASPEEYATKLEVIRTSARKASRDPEAITPALQPYIAVAPTEQEARAMLASKAGRYAALLLVPAEEWLKVGVEHPFGESFRGYVDFVPERYDRRSIEEAIASVPPELVGRNFIWGTPEQVASRLRAFGEAGLRHVVLTLTSALFSKRMAVYGLRATRTIARLLNIGRQ